MSIRDTKLWTWHVAAGLVILVLLGLHMVIMHLPGVIPLAGLNPAGPEPLEWANVTYRARQAFFMITYVLLLGAALFHGLYGLRNILFELNPSQGVKGLISTVFVVVGIGLMLLGTWAAVAARTAAMAGIAAL